MHILLDILRNFRIKRVWHSGSIRERVTLGELQLLRLLQSDTEPESEIFWCGSSCPGCSALQFEANFTIRMQSKYCTTLWGLCFNCRLTCISRTLSRRLNNNTTLFIWGKVNEFKIFKNIFSWSFMVNFYTLSWENK